MVVFYFDIYTVSYTHLDVYKRQALYLAQSIKKHEIFTKTLIYK